jgi:hypothetical protein
MRFRDVIGVRPSLATSGTTMNAAGIGMDGRQTGGYFRRAALPGVRLARDSREGLYRKPLPSRNLNEFRIPTQDGHVVSVQF